MDGDDATIQIIGQEAKMVALGERIRRSARSTVPVTITGERGTGKGLIAQAFHHYSYRANKPFVTVPCATIPEPLLERELFGHESRPSTGRGRWIGAFERARNGTLFLEDIDSLSPELQTTLLHVVQERSIRRLKGQSPIPVDVRILTATCTDLQPLVYAGHFRAELYYRLRVLSIEVPPLRARRGDIPLLVEYFLTWYTRPASQPAPGISPAAMEVLQAYDWPGNVQELENLIQRLVVRAPQGRIQRQDLPRELHIKCTTPYNSLVEDTRHFWPVRSPFGPAALRRFLERRSWN
jgi:DNA-binding NtrC family response regulator